MQATKWMAGMMVVMMASACTTHYTVTGIERTRLLIDNTYDVPAKIGRAHV